MAEFAEVVKQKARMCKTIVTCIDCKLNFANNDDNEDCVGFIDNYPEKAEKIIMEWAAAHPEPRYPSWADGWKQLFPEATLTDTLYSAAPCPRHFIQRSLDKCDSCKDCLNEPMPEEVARKLGIKPLEGGNDRG